MSEEIIRMVDEAIEEELNSQVNSLIKNGISINLAGEFVENFYAIGKFEIAQHFQAGLGILIPKIMENSVTRNFIASPNNENSRDVKRIGTALDFGASYRWLRDMIYMSYAQPDSVSWKLRGNTILVEIKDKSIPRQFVHELQMFIMNSLSRKDGVEYGTFEYRTLKGTQQWDFNDTRVTSALKSISIESTWKIQHYFNHLPPDSEVDVGGYSYAMFLLVYQEILSLALYERYHSSANSISCVVTYPEDALADAVAKAVELDVEKCRAILLDLSACSDSTLNYISATRSYILFPSGFSLRDGIGSALKQVATRNSKGFSGTIAGPIGESLVKEVAGYFSKFKNFKVMQEVSLQGFDPSLPDIDCLAISYEPSMGFHFFLCEIKNNLPASWAKEYLKALGKKGFIEKALGQTKKISLFLRSQEGQKLLYDLAVSSFPHLDLKMLFPTGFCGVVDMIVVSSQSVGIFFPETEITIIDCDGLRHILSHCDGDVTYIQHNLRKWNETLDACYTLKKKNLNIGKLNIEYEAPTLEKVLKLAENKYLSVGALEQIESESMDSGYRYIDTLLEKR